MRLPGFLIVLAVTILAHRLLLAGLGTLGATGEEPWPVRWLRGSEHHPVRVPLAAALLVLAGRLGGASTGDPEARETGREGSGRMAIRKLRTDFVGLPGAPSSPFGAPNGAQEATPAHRLSSHLAGPRRDAPNIGSPADSDSRGRSPPARIHDDHHSARRRR